MSKNSEQILEFLTKQGHYSENSWNSDYVNDEYVDYVLSKRYKAFGNLKLEIEFNSNGKEQHCCNILHYGNSVPSMSKELESTNVNDAVNEAVEFLKDEVKKLAIELGLMR